MKEVQDRFVQYANRYKLVNTSTGEELGTFDFTAIEGTVVREGTPINKELFDSIDKDIKNRIKYTEKIIEVDSGSGEASTSLLAGGVFLKSL